MFNYSQNEKNNQTRYSQLLNEMYSELRLEMGLPQKSKDYHTSVSNRLMRMYDIAIPHDRQKAKQLSRSMTSSAPQKFEVFLSGMRRQKNVDLNRIYQKRGASLNKLGFSQYSIIYKNQMAIAPDGTPIFPYHFLFRPVVSDCINELFKQLDLDDLKIGEVSEGHLDLRPEFSFDDIMHMSEFVQRVPSFMISQSMIGSGASIPNAIHAHAFPVKTTEFPLFSSYCASSGFDLPGLLALDQITFGIIVTGTPFEIACVFMALTKEFKLPSNHYFQYRTDFNGLTGLYIPRTSEIPMVERLAEAEWCFGAFEVLGLFDAINEDIYHTLTTEEAEEAIKSVTVQAPDLRNEFIKKAVSVLKELKC